MKKYPTSYRLSEQGLRLLALVADHYSTNHTSAIERLIRDEAKRLHIQAKEPEHDRLRDVPRKE